MSAHFACSPKNYSNTFLMMSSSLVSIDLSFVAIGVEVITGASITMVEVVTYAPITVAGAPVASSGPLKDGPGLSPQL